APAAVLYRMVTDPLESRGRCLSYGHACAERPDDARVRDVEVRKRLGQIRPGLQEREPGLGYFELGREASLVAQRRQLIDPLGLLDRALPRRDLRARTLTLAQRLPVLELDRLLELGQLQLRGVQLRPRLVELRRALEALEDRELDADRRAPVGTRIGREVEDTVRVELTAVAHLQRDRRQERALRDPDLLLPDRDLATRRLQRSPTIQQRLLRGRRRRRQLRRRGRRELRRQDERLLQRQVQQT